MYVTVLHFFILQTVLSNRLKSILKITITWPMNSLKAQLTSAFRHTFLLYTITELQLFSTTELERLATQKIVQKEKKTTETKPKKKSTELHNLPIQLLDQDLQKSCELLLLFSASKIFFCQSSEVHVKCGSELYVLC